MPESAPEIVRPAIFTVTPVPTLELANVPTALPLSKVTVSPAIIPDSAAAVVLSVAAVVPSYSLLAAVIPVTVRALAVIAKVSDTKVIA